MNLNELNNLMINKIAETQPLKFISPRFLAKKINTNNTENAQPLLFRCFNPRLTPYLYSDQYKNKMSNNNRNFIDNNNINLFDNKAFPLFIST